MLANIRAYIDSLPADSDHPFVRGKPETYGIEAWALFLGEKGHTAPHIHPEGWLSGVYYAKIPENLREDDAERHGWIQFGQTRNTSEPPIAMVCPCEGEMLLFPSHTYHGTVPYTGTETRVSIAFDVIPQRQRS